MQQREQDGDRLLLVPGEHERERQVVHAAAEGLGKCRRHHERAVGVVALTHVEQARKARVAQLAEVEVVEAELAAGQREHDRVGGRVAHELRVVVAAGLGTVATAHEEDVAELAGADGLDHLVGHAKHRVVPESRRDAATAVHALLLVELAISAQLEGLIDHG